MFCGGSLSSFRTIWRERGVRTPGDARTAGCDGEQKTDRRPSSQLRKASIGKAACRGAIDSAGSPTEIRCQKFEGFIPHKTVK